jgi:hypothetical protein
LLIYTANEHEVKKYLVKKSVAILERDSGLISSKTIYYAKQTKDAAGEQGELLLLWFVRG